MVCLPRPLNSLPAPSLSEHRAFRAAWLSTYVVVNILTYLLLSFYDLCAFYRPEGLRLEECGVASYVGMHLILGPQSKYSAAILLASLEATFTFLFAFRLDRITIL